ncbi:putative permease [Actinoplanes missouriensis 431]|uniref:Putative permease n=1 Tax=Actinoplanes missouriensis (strain ATCC 14538 / DSM 43046 / CBS 188.64 / JCM 3121 / NBRC 102363 / NCIMB 12654 / NRRL B-3342 / UNCC 431) TaxID=512565 RepID=I0HAF7_ACTM4|nr:FtsX-like permease family protein [Actinoplanes missouriensis]BAL89994.1 putative permease [Actinoplanes missouriensis 431]
MRAVWTAARAAARRRKMQTFVIFLVVLACTTSGLISLALLDAADSPFDRAFAAQRGAHAVVTYDPARVTDAQLTAATTGVQAAAGPFGQVIVEPRNDVGPVFGQPLTVVGRADPGGPVDRVDLWHGRWPSAPGEIVLNEPPLTAEDFRLGPLADVTELVTPAGTLTVVGYAFTLSGSADGWVTPAQMATMRPTGTQMLYRFTGDVATREALRVRLSGVTTGLPGDALLAAQPYLVMKDEAAEGPGVYLPFLGTFGVLGLLVAVIIVGNVVSGAVISGFRHIGVLKSLGFTPRQVVAVYLTMVSMPAVVGAALGTVLGVAAVRPMLTDTFRGLGFGQEAGIRSWVIGAALVGVPLIVVIAALLPAWRAHRLSAAEAISAGSAPRRGRGLRVQRALSGSRLPRSISLGLGLPFARPTRTALTMASLLLGVVSVTFALGLSDSVIRITEVGERAAGEIGVRAFNGREHTPSERSDAEVEQMLRGLPGTARVGVAVNRDLSVAGQSEPLKINFVRGDMPAMGYQEQLYEGHWMTAPDQLVLPTQLLNERGLTIGEKLTVSLDGDWTTFTIVGETVRGLPGPEGAFAAWRDFPRQDPNAYFYQVQTVAGTDLNAYADKVTAADPGLDAWNNTGGDSFSTVITAFSGVLALMLATVAALGVLNTVALNVTERRRDLGMLKSIGMTPRQVVAMVVTSMAALGVVAGVLGIPLGLIAHRIVLPLSADAAKIRLPEYVMQVWDPATVALLLLSGVGIAVAGALLPARAAARLTIARVLHNE